MSKIKVTQTRSTIGRLRSHKSCIKGLGLRRIGHTVRGMASKVFYMVKVEEV